MAANATEEDKRAAEAGYSDLDKECVQRLAAARVWKAYFELDFKECYFFTAPWRQRQISSMTAPGQQRMLDAVELNTDEAFIIPQDFVTEIVNTYMPQAQAWCERGPGMFLPDGVWDKVKDDVKKDDAIIFDAMKSSNLYAELTKALYPDLAIGTAGLWIEKRPGLHPISVMAVPLREMELNLGPDGQIDDRFVVRYTRNVYVRKLLGEDIWEKVDPETKKSLGEKGNERTQVIWGFWRLWDRKDDEVWQHVVMLGSLGKERLIHKYELVGEGSCPFLPFRFNPTADWVWGFGPMLQGLPTFRQIDEMEIMFTEHSEKSINPAITYPTESFANVEQGIEPGMAYPIRPGEENAVKAMFVPPPPEAANYQYEAKLKKLRKLFFVDYPEQTGDTPPTLGQWLDEMARAQRRIGTPGLPFWQEGPAQIFLRFKYILEVNKAIKPVQVNGSTVSLRPFNPTQRAAEQQEIATALQGLQAGAAMFPEEFKVHIDGAKTLTNIYDKMRITNLVAFRKPGDVKAAVAQIAQLAQNKAGGPAPAPGAEAPAPAGQ